MIPLQGWEKTNVEYPEGLHPVSRKCGLIMTESQVEKEKIFITLMLWKKGDRKFTKKELRPVKDIKISDDQKTVDILLADGARKQITFD